MYTAVHVHTLIVARMALHTSYTSECSANVASCDNRLYEKCQWVRKLENSTFAVWVTYI